MRNMESKYEKVIGYIFLALGVIMILISVYFMFIVFTGAINPPRLFNFHDIYINTSEGEKVLIFSSEEISKLLSMLFWFLLMFFIMMAGGKIASLGINLIKEIKVEVKK
ncbi:MAG: hypothetical protein QXP55_00360 [Nitrososphaerales archaeon]